MTFPPAADLVVTGARLFTGLADHSAGPDATAFAVRDGRFLAVGSDAELAELARGGGRHVDLGGRRVLPGLQDSHLHAVRAGLTWNTEVHWEEATSLADAMERLRAAAAQAPAGTWLPVVGGWHARQFTEGRPPTPDELDRACPDHPVFAQMLYEQAVLNSAALAACGWDTATADPPGGTLERAADGRPTGVVRGMGGFRAVLDRIPAPTTEQQEAGTLAMLRTLAGHGMTAVIDGGGLFMSPESYRAVFALWRRRELPVRMRLFASASTAGHEVDELTAWMRHGTAGFGDDLLRVCGLGEVVHLGCHDLEGFTDFRIDETSYRELVEIGRRAAAAGWPMSVHAVLDSSLGRVLDAFEQVAAETDIRPLRWSIVHADEASEANIARMASLGLGVLVQDRMVLQAPDYVDLWGAAQAARTPPLGELRTAGLPVAGGSDATRASRYLPWTSLWWLVTGGTATGTGTRAAAHRLSVAEALHAYSHAGAWFTFEERTRGRIAPGYAADFFAPTADPFAADPDTLPDIRSDWTVMSGRTTHSTGAVDGTATRTKETQP